MKTRRIIIIKLKRNKRARNAQRIKKIKYYITLISMFTTLLTWGLMTSTALN